MWGLAAPSVVAWPAGPGTDFLLEVYDWDTVALAQHASHREGDGRSADLAVKIDLCTRFYPCTLSLSGADGLGGGHGALHQSGAGAIVCIASSGCTGLSVQSLDLLCGDGGVGGWDSVLQVRTQQLD